MHYIFETCLHSSFCMLNERQIVFLCCVYKVVPFFMFNGSYSLMKFGVQMLWKPSLSGINYRVSVCEGPSDRSASVNAFKTWLLI